ncbi:hypothetical protein D187_008437 [Cystobacter fuscus DSM 2262]|uniref:Uncharacterized protein n=1 Tax=Cystobacter fuscus (strain ATCC 25194 / DSM 2262 / NBRC 100088 / M29) TaxID=1242864 RepID=S9PCY7_CYSF2|nr:hypothetical protein D187_008437 [Cystobacter fuscus DSM 2262]
MSIFAPRTWCELLVWVAAVLLGATRTGGAEWAWSGPSWKLSWGDGETWGDGEAGDGETWGDGEVGDWGLTS